MLQGLIRRTAVGGVGAAGNEDLDSISPALETLSAPMSLPSAFAEPVVEDRRAGSVRLELSGSIIASFMDRWRCGY